jgi:VanZ family protein
LARSLTHVVAGLVLLAVGIAWAALEIEPGGVRRFFARPRSDRLLWAIVWVLLTADVSLSLSPQPVTTGGSSLINKALHFFGYLALTLSLLLAAVWRPGRGDGRWAHRAGHLTLAVASLGAFLELVQALIGRRPELIDTTVNAVGCMAGLLVWRAFVADDRQARAVLQAQMAAYNGRLQKRPPPPPPPKPNAVLQQREEPMKRGPSGHSA